jgi:SAM-dependent methyltransferase
MSVFYEVSRVPVHSVLLLPTQKEAVEYTKGDIALGFCEECGFISNLVFDPRLHEYSARYEETQGFSSTFSTFQRSLAQRLIDEYDLHKKTIIEIGCGKGEFLSLLCELGENTGIGFDPAYIPARNVSPAKDRMTFIQDFYGEKYSNYQADFVCCKMTLEHIPDVAEFMKTVRRSIGNRRDTIVFFQIPEVRRILREQAFWDIYYEHCSYFSQGSLARLFRKSGFDVMDLGTEYDDQYLMIEARPGTGRSSPALDQENDLDELKADVAYFTESLQPTLEKWNRRLSEIRQTGRRVVIWGGGSKGVAFLTKLGVTDEIPYAVDINPYKHGTFMAGTGQEIVGPEFLKRFHPDLVVVMNPIYREEIKADLQKLGLSPEILAITD